MFILSLAGHLLGNCFEGPALLIAKAMQTALSPQLVSSFLNLRQRLLVSIRRLVRSHATAEDIVQETFLRLWERQERLPDASQLDGYVVRTGRNLAIDYKRRERIAPFVDGVEQLEFITDHCATPEDQTIARQQVQALSAAIAALPPRARDVFVMARIDGMTYVEIGRALGISPKTVFSHMVVALERLDRFQQAIR